MEGYKCNGLPEMCKVELYCYTVQVKVYGYKCNGLPEMCRV